MEHDTIDGVKVIYEFKVLWHEWECDGLGWVTEDGRTWLTSHGTVHEASKNDLQSRIDEAKSCIRGIREARRMAKTRRAESASPRDPKIRR